MYLPDFEYYAPESATEVCKLLSEFGNRAKVYAGGSDLLPRMKHELIAPEVLVSLKKVAGINTIEKVAGKGLVIGAGATLNDLVFSEIVQKEYKSLSSAAKSMAANQVRHIGTIGGNIASAVPSADLPPILIALNATVETESADGGRTIPLEEVFTGPQKNCLKADEIITKIIIPEQKTTGSKYFKYALRKSGALAVVGVAVSVVVENGVINDARVVLGAVAPTPIRAVETENLLKGKQVSDQLFEEAGNMAKSESKPISDLRASQEYRRHLVYVFTKRALKAAVNEGHS